MVKNYQNRDMSEAERRRRAAARKKRKRQILINRIIFAVVCLVALAAIVFGIVQVVKLFKGKGAAANSSGSGSAQSGSSLSSEGTASASIPASAPDSAPQSQPESQPAVMEEGDWLLTLVNNNVPLPENWEINVAVAEASNQKELADVAALAYQKMKAAAALDGIDLLLCSGYRTVEYQQELFDKQKKKWLDKGMSEEEAFNEAKKVVAVPGYSEHNSGLAADIVTPKHQNLDAAFGKTEAGQWLASHAPEYGFILRYPENKQAITGIIYEPWHFRYVGVENAKAITESGKCLEEYLDENT